MRFGIFIPQGWRHDLVDIDPADHWRVMASLAQRADEGTAWESIWVYDHFHTVPVPSEEATHEAWTLMSAFAASTGRIRLGQMCTCTGYRNPAYLAKVAATVDVISGGRLEMGIGAGWYEHEWRAYGYGFPDAPQRLRQLGEGVEIMTRAWRDGEVTFSGREYQVDGAIVRPLPLQQGGIPLWVAGGGEKVTLKIAAKHAQYTNFSSDPETFVRKRDILHSHCAAIGRDPREITLSANFSTVVAATDAEVADRLDAIEARLAPYLGDAIGGYMAEYRSGAALVGTPAMIVERLRALQAEGLAYAIHYFPEHAYDRTGVDLFEREVVPALR
ncbi:MULTISPECIES: LLM class F420-dependent oxidoreductase [Microbacterium]|uniref:Pristinamycin IIA synthase subunit A n=2 Tax=Microbacterium TaxID=33882 RepID=A0A0F0LYS2_9MICO|nr:MULTISPECIES: LLM class F420-dependent oxidoreductase [Microbacterium]MCK9917438.1 LLM class F420-dependent oxidoreductase [Microbacteriaceae bacterium K1510]KJL39321.1 Pristinamycin IIA synthase subunit A [Microbacterium ginsengisoli]KQR97725.1 LLM class F420-dependent oxidoreductase [Microbacterium sp. Leaf347]MBN9198553.1 LLM class F420-dependent oxidoreductase [Microbacterium ginsengisoli]OJU78067.1 MAG: LLM class F420-dependent oxidoreductase [Microbacterium sp. 71-23]